MVAGNETSPSYATTKLQGRPQSSLVVSAGGKVDVGGTLTLGAYFPGHFVSEGYVYVTAGGSISTDQATGPNGAAYVYGDKARWQNEGIFAAPLWIGKGGIVSTNTFTGGLTLNGGSLITSHYIPEGQSLISGHLIVSKGTYQSVDSSVANGVAVTIEKGAFGDNLGTLTVGGQSTTNMGTLTVASGSTVDWGSITLMRSGELRVTGVTVESCV